MGESRSRPIDRVAPQVNRQIWFMVGLWSFVLSYISFNCKLFMKVPGEPPKPDPNYSVLIQIFGYVFVSFPYLYLLNRMAVVPSEPPPLRVVLRGSDKQMLESAFVVFSSGWGYYTMDKCDYVAVVGLALCLSLVGTVNLCLYFDNISYLDCCFIVAVETAVFYFRRDVVLLIAVSVVGLALQLMKNVAFSRYYHQSKNMIKNSKPE